MKNYQKIPTDLATRKEWIDFVYDHPVVQDLSKGHFHLDIKPAYVDPDTRIIDHKNTEKNTHFEVWIEGGPPHDMSQDEWPGEPADGWTEYNRYMNSHDYRLDCGGDTLEEALLNFAARLKYYYEDDGTDKGEWDDE